MPDNGYLVGMADINGFQDAYAEAIFTEDGEIRIALFNLFGDATHDNGPRVDWQFAGKVDPTQFGPVDEWFDPVILDGIEGDIVMVTESCELLGQDELPGAQFQCYEEPWEIFFRFSEVDSLDGLLSRPADFAGIQLNLSQPHPADLTQVATLALAEGSYREKLAFFAQQGEVIVTVDGLGNIFFQSAETGCTGNGSLAPHAGSLKVYDVGLLIEGCTGRSAYLNGELEGLATRTVGDSRWGDSLLMSLSTAPGAAKPAGLTLHGEKI